MLVFSNQIIGNKLLAIRKRLGMTQTQVAEAAELSDRAYADIERGLVNMRMETILRICHALHVTPNDILTENTNTMLEQENELFARLKTCTPKDRETALKLLSVFLDSLSN